MANARFVAAPRQDKYRPAFVVEKLEGTYTRKVYKKTDMGLEQSTVEEPNGYMVTFLKGHSIHVKDEVELARLGITNYVPIIDTSSPEGDEVMRIPLAINASKPVSVAASTRTR